MEVAAARVFGGVEVAAARVFGGVEVAAVGFAAAGSKAHSSNLHATKDSCELPKAVRNQSEKGDGMHIGLLEDNPAIQDYIQMALNLNGHDVSIYTFGDALLDVLFPRNPVHTSLPYDLVIIDLNLPGNLSGRDVIVHIRKTVSPQMLPIIIISGAEQHQLEQMRLLFPDISCIQKPLRLHVLLQMLETSKKRKS